MPKYIEKLERMTMPVIAVRGLVAFPSIPVNFELKRDISVAAFDAAEAADGTVFIVTQRDTGIEEPSAGDLFTVGVAARIKQSLKTPEGAVRVMAEGLCRASVISYFRKSGAIFAEVMTKTVTLETGDSDLRCEAYLREAQTALENMLHYVPSATDELMLAVRAIKNPGLCADFIAANALVRYTDKQRVLEEFVPLRRLELLTVILESEAKLLKTEMEIHKKVTAQIDENQRDYYLREQMRVIQEELNGADDTDEYYDKIMSQNLPDEVRDKLLKETSRLARTPFGSPESAVMRNYIETCLELPWNKRSADRLDVALAKRILDRDHDGLEKPKQRILEYLAVKRLNPELKNQILCFVGPPGVGKTSLGSSIAHAMKREYVRVSLGGIRDEADIRGHRKTYIGSMPGRIMASLTQCGTNNPVMLLDEIDKMCRDSHGDPTSAMLEVLDAEQNRAFRDHFIELPFDLSEVMFIATANTTDTIPRALLDRMEVIHLNTYTKNEKLAIAKNHLIPKQLKRHGLTKRTLKLTENAVSEIIDGYTRESGVRNLEREIASLCRKSARKIVEDGEKCVKIDRDDIEKYLGARRFIDDGIADDDQTGVVNGLAYTEVGGDLLKIECVIMNGTGKLELTGSLGDVMKESAKLCISYVRAHYRELSVPEDFYKTRDIHIHVPEGAVPKDGPSAGVSMLTSLVSALTGKAVRRDTAMTGELTLTGRVLAIGGLREKTTAAFNAGVKRVIIPYDNRGDLEEIDQSVRASLLFIYAKTAKDVLCEALCSKAADGAVQDDSTLSITTLPELIPGTANIYKGTVL